MFLGQSPPPPHVSLVDTIRNAVGDANTRCFPVSAFGAHDIQSDGAEVPRRDGPLLESRGLEDGFIWTAERCDALRVERLEGAANAASWLAFPQMLLGMTEAGLETQSSAWRRWFNGVSVASSISTAWKLRRSFPKNSPLRVRTAGAIRKLGLKLASQALALLIVLLALFVVIETSLDGINYREVCTTREDPAATEEILQHGEVWLDRYFVSPSFRHWLSCRSIVDRSEAHSLLVQFRMRRDNGLWKTVTDAEHPQTRLILARKYHDTFPAGMHHSDAETLLTDAERQAWETNNKEHLNQIKLEVDAIPTNATTHLDELHRLSERVGNIPHHEASSDSIATLQQELRDLIAQKQTKIAESGRTADWEKFTQNYYSLKKNKNVGDAARELVSRTPKEDALRDLVADFSRDAPLIIRGKVQDALKGRSWQLARESARMSEDPNVVKLLPVLATRELQKLGRDIDEAEDRDLYDQIKLYKPQCGDQLDAYLSRAPSKTMKAEVETYRQYVNAMRGPLDLKLSLTGIQWHDNYWAWRVNYYNDVTVQVRGKPLIAAAGIKSTRNTRSADIGDGKLTAGLNETITVDVSIVAKHGLVIISTMSGGSGSWTGTPNQLRSGLTIDLNGEGFTNKATFALTGIPPEPTLPDWKN